MNTEATDDVFRDVEYSQDKWTMNRVPRGLLGCIAGLVLIVFIEPRPPGMGTFVLFGLLMLIGLLGVLIGAALDRLFDGNPLWLALLILTAAILVFVSLGVAAGIPIGPRRSGSPPLYVLGWIGVFIGLGYISYALGRHYFPARPALMLSTAGITYRTAHLKSVLIPWHEIERIGPLELGRHTGYPNRYPDITTLTLDTEFYERHILPNKRFAPGGGWDTMFFPEEVSTQMALPHPIWFSIDAKDIREPVEARWKAFKDRHDSTTSVPRTNVEASRGTPIVYGRWKADGSPWQTIRFFVPLAGVLGLFGALIAYWLR
jgi:hypothetical protein